MTSEKNLKLFLTMAAVILVGLAGIPQVAAQGKDFPRFTMFGSAGLMNPLGDLGKHVGEGYTVSFGGGYNLTRRLAWVAEYTYNQPSVSDEVLQALAVTVGKVKVWGLTGNAFLRMNRTGKVDFYGIAGAGFYQRRVKFPLATTQPITIPDDWWGYGGGTTIPKGTVLGGRFSNALGFNFGGGVTFEVYKGFRGYVEARYHHAFTNVHDTRMLPITAGIRW